MDDATFQKLEFDVVRESLAGCCACSLGKALARSLRPSSRPGQVRIWFDQVTAMQNAAEAHGMPPMGGIHDVRDEVRAASFPTPLEPDTLANIAETLNATTVLRQWFDQVGAAQPTLQRIGERISDLSALAGRIYEVVDTRGRVRDYASRKLADIRKAITHARERLKGVTDRLLRQSGVTRMLQYAGATFHGDRFVLPLKSEYRGRIPGIIHRSSDTGCTLFVEPAESVELNNAVVRLKDEETKEINRLLRDLCNEVSSQ